ncbi:MAG: hypothetical protein GZ091_09185 [Paludibacter sp.]|nr:hypothetical protein [Paludibacter sp.]
MRIIFFTIVFITLISMSILAQETSISRVPKQYSVEIGYRNVFYQPTNLLNVNNVVNQATNGYGFLLDYGWQLSGLDGKKAAAFITVPIGYTAMMPDNASSKRISMLNYGWTVRHELKKDGKIVPFLGYGLLLNTLKIDGTPGSVMGHQTQFEFGTNFYTSTRLKYFAKIQGSYTSYPKLGVKERLHFMFADLRVGVRF